MKLLFLPNKHTKIHKIKYLEKQLEIHNMLHNYKCKLYYKHKISFFPRNKHTIFNTNKKVLKNKKESPHYYYKLKSKITNRVTWVYIFEFY